MHFLEESYKRYKKFKFEKFWERPLFEIREFAFNRPTAENKWTEIWDTTTSKTNRSWKQDNFEDNLILWISQTSGVNSQNYIAVKL